MAERWVDDREKGVKNQAKREIPHMPEGYYSGDRPNPNLRAFVEEHIREKPYDPETDDYDVPAFNEPITTTKATAIYNMHTYWSKKPHDAIRQYIRHYTEEGDLVLDPFCGSGGTALAALMEGRKAIAIDRSPAATFITKNYCTPVDVDELQAAFEELKAKVKPEIDWLYETRCDRCGGKATTAYTVYSQVFQCPRCMEKVPLFDCVETEGRTKAGKPKKIRVCPHCYKNGHLEEIRSQSKKFGAVPVLVSYLCENGCKPKRAERQHDDPDPKKREYFEMYDIGKIREIERRKMHYWHPKGYDMTGFSRYKRDALRLYNVEEVSDLFTKRNLWAISAIVDISKIFPKYSDLILFSTSAILFSSSRMYLWTKDGQHGFISGTYYLPQVSREINVINQFLDKFRSLKHLSNLELKSTELLLSTDSATDLPNIFSNSIDYIFTDPPYAGKVQYGELNFAWEAWLQLDTTWHDEEITINDIREKTEDDWATMMKLSLSECFRILKPGRWISLCYHDTSEGTWQFIQDIMTEIGFIPDSIDNAIFIDSVKKTYNQYIADKVNKRDLVINFRKPLPGEVNGTTITGDEDTATFNEKVRSIVRDFLSISPGATKDRIYDDLVSRMVRSGRMEAHDFDALLAEIADPAASDSIEGNGMAQRWYLKEAELEVVDLAESAKEDAASESVNSFISAYLSNHPGSEGVHYSDIFEHYIYAVKDKPRRPLVEWLPDYFYKTDAGTYRLPATEEEEQVKKEGRLKGMNRRIKRYLAYIERGVPIPENDRPDSATLTDWLRHCRRSGQYRMGKLLYERGGIVFDHLPDEQQIEIEEDYVACVRMLDQGASAAKTRQQTQSTLI